jgi:threonine synthase
VKALFTDQPFNEKYPLGVVNSTGLVFVVPMNNSGDIPAGYYAKRMGLPMGKLVVSTNSNDILARFWRSGRYEQIDSTPPTPDGGLGDRKPADGDVQATFSPAMDILLSSNSERLLWYPAYESSSVAPDNASRALLEPRSTVG